MPGGKHFVVRNDLSGSSIIAFAVGEKWKAGNPFAMVATHVDSPCLKVKPVSIRSTSGYLQLGVQTYGGGLWHTWFDRDLSAAGRVIVRTGTTSVETRLVKLDDPLVRVTSLAMHYNKQNPFEFNTETQLLPIAGLESAETLEKYEPPSKEELDVSISNDANVPIPDARSINEEFVPTWRTSDATKRHLFGIVKRVAQKLQVSQDDIIDFDLSLYDTQPSAIGGINSDFIYAPRIDNLGMTFCSLIGFTRSLSNLSSDSTIRLLCCYDNEEIGSKTALGGASTFLPNTLRRLSYLRTPGSFNEHDRNPTLHDQALTRSFLISADMIHAYHPAFPGYHESNHRPLLNAGIVFSTGLRSSFVKNTPGTVLLSEIACWGSGVPAKMQHFTTPNNIGCGSTLGPILATKLGVRTVDLGNAMLSMHSIREVCGREDVENAVEFLQGFWERFARVDEVFKID